jgi:SAM-dependent methyltransferase
MTRPPVAEAPARVEYERRAEYASSWPPDVFIVPMLKDWIEPTLRECLPADGHTRRVIDVGCGRQPFRALIESLGGTYTGMDVHQTPDNAVAFLGAVDDPLPPGVLDGGPYDVVLCTEVLEHVANWPAAFANLAALLAPGGRLVLTCPHAYQLHEEPYDFFRPTDHAIRWHARHAGLEPVRVERLGNGWDVLGGVIANLWPIPKQRRLFDRAVGWAARALFRRVLFPLLRNRWLHRRLSPGGPLYLANAAVLRKP